MANYFDLTRGQKPPADIDRSKTVICEGEVSSWEIFDFMKRWRGLETMQYCQKISGNVHHITFASRDVSNALVQSGPVVKMRNKEVTVKDLEKVRKIFVKQLPSEFPKGELHSCMLSYGRVFSIEPEFYRDDNLIGIRTGTFIVKILMKKRVPDYLYVGGHRALCYYSTIERTCRKCGKVGHLANSCVAAKSGPSSSKGNKKGSSASAVIKGELPAVATGAAILSTGAKPKKGKKKKKNNYVNVL